MKTKKVIRWMIQHADVITPMTHRNKEERMHERSMVSPSFAKAFFEANP